MRWTAMFRDLSRLMHTCENGLGMVYLIFVMFSSFCIDRKSRAEIPLNPTSVNFSNVWYPRQHDLAEQASQYHDRVEQIPFPLIAA
jgi:hypothetical protein